MTSVRLCVERLTLNGVPNSISEEINPNVVMPAKAGIQGAQGARLGKGARLVGAKALDPRFRGDDREGEPPLH